MTSVKDPPARSSQQRPGNGSASVGDIGWRESLVNELDSSAARFLSTPVRVLLGMPGWIWAMLAVLVAGSIISFGGVSDVPEDWHFGSTIAGGVDDAVDWMVVSWDPVFRAINIGLLRYLLLPLEKWLLLLPWWLITATVGLIAFRIVGKGFAVLAVVLMTAMAILGQFDLAMQTLALVAVATLLAVVIGVPTGILASSNDRIDVSIRPLLDAMQTLPSFVYLIPVLMLFGLGKVPAVLATVVYAVPPIIRLTNLGIRQVDPSVIEAARAFGTTRVQMLIKVQIPLAMPTVMAGLNQTIMMGLAMVIIAALIGAKGLGVEVLNGIARLEVGRGLLAGLGIVVMAIILDRITQGLAKGRESAHQSE